MKFNYIVFFLISLPFVGLAQTITPTLEAEGDGRAIHLSEVVVEDSRISVFDKIQDDVVYEVKIDANGDLLLFKNKKASQVLQWKAMWADIYQRRRMGMRIPARYQWQLKYGIEPFEVQFWRMQQELNPTL